MGHFVEGIRDVVEVACVETGDGDTSVHGHVDGVLLTEFVDLVFVETSESEHADLVNDVAPVVFVAESLELVTKTVSHCVHAA